MSTKTTTSASSEPHLSQPTSTSFSSLSSLSSFSTSHMTPSSSPTQSAASGRSGKSTPAKKYTAGTVAGISIGTAIAGAIVAALILFFVMRTHKKKRGSSHSLKKPAGGFHTHSTHPPPDSHWDAGNGTGKPLPSTNVDLILPQPLDDASVGDEVDKLRKLIQDHVDSNYYHDQPTKNAVHESRLPSILPAAIAILKGRHVEDMLDNAQTRFNTLKTVIAAEVLAAIDYRGDPRRSLLPQIVAAFMDSTLGKSEDTPQVRLSLSRWRVSTHLLLGTRVSDERKADLEQAISALMQKLDVVLLPFADTKTEEARREHLLGVCERAERVGMLLLSQPASWSFEWTYLPRISGASDGRQGRKSIKAVVVFPALVRLTDNSARKLERPRMVLEPRVKG